MTGESNMDENKKTIGFEDPFAGTPKAATNKTTFNRSTTEGIGDDSEYVIRRSKQVGKTVFQL